MYLLHRDIDKTRFERDCNARTENCDEHDILDYLYGSDHLFLIKGDGEISVAMRTFHVHAAIAVKRYIFRKRMGTSGTCDCFPGMLCIHP